MQREESRKRCRELPAGHYHTSSRECEPLRNTLAHRDKLVLLYTGDKTKALASFTVHPIALGHMYIHLHGSPHFPPFNPLPSLPSLHTPLPSLPSLHPPLTPLPHSPHSTLLSLPHSTLLSLPSPHSPHSTLLSLPSTHSHHHQPISSNAASITAAPLSMVAMRMSCPGQSTKETCRNSLKCPPQPVLSQGKESGVELPHDR